MSIKAISLSRPWTRLVLENGKNIENRTWNTTYRGPLIIHAAKSWDGEAAALLAEAILTGAYIAFAELRHLKGLHPVGYLGVVDLVDVCGDGCWSHEISDCGPWAMPGQFHWRLTNPRRFPEPIPGPGRLGLFEPAPEVLTAAAALITPEFLDA